MTFWFSPCEPTLALSSWPLTSNISRLGLISIILSAISASFSRFSSLTTIMFLTESGNLSSQRVFSTLSDTSTPARDCIFRHSWLGFMSPNSSPVKSFFNCRSSLSLKIARSRDLAAVYLFSTVSLIIMSHIFSRYFGSRLATR